MTAAPLDHRISPEEYLERERAAFEKSEYFDGVVRAMSGTSFPHALIVSNISGELRNRLRGSECRAVTQDVRLRPKGDKSYMYPDVIVLCGEPELEDDQLDTLHNPTVLIEVLSPSTERYDRGEKFRRYRKIETLREYILVAQERAHIEQFTRQGDLWVLSEWSGRDNTLHLSSVNVALPLAEIYDGVTLADTPPE